jgi:probable HAF family extracellular repeat protein
VGKGIHFRQSDGRWYEEGLLMITDRLLFSIVCVLLVCPLRSQATPPYKMIDITVPRPGVIHVTDFNDVGQVIGWYETDSGQSSIQHAFLWEAGKTIDLGMLPGDEGSVPAAINARGQIVGVSKGSQRAEYAFLWERGRMRALNGMAEWSEAWTINNRGHVLGRVKVGEDGFQPVIWNRGKRTELGSPGKIGFDVGVSASSINDGDQVAGTYMGDRYIGPIRGCVWQKGRWNYVSTEENVFDQVFAINSKGTLIGQRGEDRSWNGYLWEKGTRVMLPFEPVSLNDHDQVIGDLKGQFYLYDKGESKNLETLLPERREGYTFTRLRSINNRGQILCQDKKGFFVLIPVRTRFGR